MTMPSDPVPHEIDSFDSHLRMNVGDVDRIASTIGGSALVIAGLLRRNSTGIAIAAMGGALLYRGITGRCELCRMLGITTTSSSQARGVPHGTGIRVERTIHIQKPREEVFSFWRNLENLPRFMKHIESISENDARISHWVAVGPGNQRFEWDAELVNEHPNELLAWQTLPGSQVQHAGSVRFLAAPDGGTDVRVVMQYHPPAGRVGATIAKLIGESPAQHLEEDLDRLKELLE